MAALSHDMRERPDSFVMAHTLRNSAQSFATAREFTSPSSSPPEGHIQPPTAAVHAMHPPAPRDASAKSIQPYILPTLTEGTVSRQLVDEPLVHHHSDARRSASAGLAASPSQERLNLKHIYGTHPPLLAVSHKQQPSLVPLFGNGTFLDDSPYPALRSSASQTFNAAGRSSVVYDGSHAQTIPSSPQREPFAESTVVADLFNGRPAGQPVAHSRMRRQPEICVECMMRDRDMVDIDVTSKGVWARLSDVDYLDALAAENALLAHDMDMDSHDSDHLERRRSDLRAVSDSDENGQSISSSYTSADRARQRLLPSIRSSMTLTSANLVLWTSLNVSATSQRWQTLQRYLADQEMLVQSTAYTGTDTPRSPVAKPNSVTSTHEKKSSGLFKAHRAAKAAKHESHADEDQRHLSSMQCIPSPSARPKVHKPTALAVRRLSSPLFDLPSHRPKPSLNDAFKYSAIDISKSYSTSRPPSVDMQSLTFSDRPRSLSRWSGYGRLAYKGPESPAQSTLSLYSSGSMLDMHVGLDHDRANPVALRTLTSQQQLQHFEYERKTPTNERPGSEAGKRKKGLRRLISRLFDSGQHVEESDFVEPILASSWDDLSAPLQPPNPSFFSGAFRTRHNRSSSLSSVSSSPHSPQELHRPPSVSVVSSSPGSSIVPHFLPHQDMHQKLDYQLQVHRSLPEHNAGHVSALPQSRQEKELPPLPLSLQSESDDADGYNNILFDPGALLDEAIGGGPKSFAKARASGWKPFKRSQNPSNSSLRAVERPIIR